MISQSKYSWDRKFTLSYQWFGMNYDFEILRVDYIYVYIAETDESAPRAGLWTSGRRYENNCDRGTARRRYCHC